MRRRIVLTDRDMTSAASSRLRYTGSVFSAIDSVISSCRGRGAEEPAGFGNGDVEAAAAVEPCPPRTDAALAPVAHGALRSANQVAELFEGDEAVVGPLLGDLDRVHVRHVL